MLSRRAQEGVKVAVVSMETALYVTAAVNVLTWSLADIHRL